MLADLDLRRLRFFVQVVEQGGFSAAAKSLASTQSTVSKAVKQLEEELNVVLLQRSSVSTALTDEGRLVYARALNLLADASELKAELDELRGLRRGQLVIGVPKMGTGQLLADVLASYKIKYPLIHLDVEIASTSELQRQLRNAELEVAALFEPAPDDIHFRLVLEDELVVLLPASHPLSAEAGIELRQLGGVPLFLSQRDIPAFQAVMAAFAAAGVPARVAAQSNNLDILYEFVKSGAGASFVPRRVATARALRSTVAVPLRRIRIPWRLGFGWIGERHLSHAANAWIEHVMALDAGVGQQQT
jgi:DNA-binding transcriptional LysR family regulator